jgi:3D (Asp-Asp-Asp) domain-containing protein
MPSPVTRIRIVTLAAIVALALPATAAAAPIARARWLGDVAVTEYYPVPEAWFIGRRVAAPGLTTKHRIDWLYSARGVSMQGTGIGLDGQLYHIDALGSGGWVTDRARLTVPGRLGWDGGSPFWRAGAYWLARGRHLTFPLEAGGWFNGRGRRYVKLPGVTFAAGESKPLRFYRSIAVDPDLIPLGSRIYIEAYRNTAGHGWFRAEDVGGAIIGRHVDVYRSPPPSPGIGAQALASQRIYVIPPGMRAGADAPGERPPADVAPPTADADPSGGATASGTSGGSTSGGAAAP